MAEEAEPAERVVERIIERPVYQPQPMAITIKQKRGLLGTLLIIGAIGIGGYLVWRMISGGADKRTQDIQACKGKWEATGKVRDQMGTLTVSRVRAPCDLFNANIWSVTEDTFGIVDHLEQDRGRGAFRIVFKKGYTQYWRPFYFEGMVNVGKNPVTPPCVGVFISTAYENPKREYTVAGINACWESKTYPFDFHTCILEKNLCLDELRSIVVATGRSTCELPYAGIDSFTIKHIMDVPTSEVEKICPPYTKQDSSSGDKDKACAEFILPRQHDVVAIYASPDTGNLLAYFIGLTSRFSACANRAIDPNSRGVYVSEIQYVDTRQIIQIAPADKLIPYGVKRTFTFLF